jgi:hypothetical protein
VLVLETAVLPIFRPSDSIVTVGEKNTALFGKRLYSSYQFIALFYRWGAIRISETAVIWTRIYLALIIQNTFEVQP